MFEQRVALLFGIEEYANYAPLPCVRRDVEGGEGAPGIHETLAQRLGKQNFDVTRFCGRVEYAASQKAIKDAIEELKNAGLDTEETLLLLYFSGHGLLIDGENEEDRFLIATSDTEGSEPTRGLRFSTLLKNQLLKLKMAVVCCIDCCHGGTAVQSARHYLQGGTKRNFAIFASSAPLEESYASGNGQSRFTHFLIDALTGRIPSAAIAREVTVRSLASAIEAQFRDEKQMPEAWHGSTEVLLARLHGPIAVQPRLARDQVAEMFRSYVQGRVNQYRDMSDITSDRYHIHNRAKAFVLAGVPRVRVAEEVYIGHATQRMKAWISDESSPLMFLLGDTGSGKTTLVQRVWYEHAKAWLEGKATRIPVVIDLRLFNGVQLSAPGNLPGLTDAPRPIGVDDTARRFRAVFTDLLQNQEGLPLFWTDFAALCREGEVLLFLDGLDEMDTDGSPGAVSANLAHVLALFDERAKIVISCRSQYLKSDYELIDILSRCVPDRVAIPTLELLPFEERQVVSYFRPRLSEEQINRWERLRQADSAQLTALCERPFLLAEIVASFDEIVSSDRVRPSRLFWCYLQAWLKRDDWRFHRFLTDFRDAIERDRARMDEATAKDRARSDLKDWKHRILAWFIEALATHLWTRSESGILASKIPSVIRTYLPQAPDVFINFFDYAIRTCSFLTRDERGFYSFVDSSILDYFAVRKFRDDILNELYPWDTSQQRHAAGPMRIPMELGLQPLTPKMLDTLADMLRENTNRAISRLQQIVETTDDRVKASPETLYYLMGNCLSIYARLNNFSIPQPLRSKLRGKWLNGAQLANCNLEKADLRGAMLDKVDLRKARLRGANLDGIQIVNSMLSGSDLSDVYINGNERAVIRVTDVFDPVKSGAPKTLENVFLLSSSKGKRSFQRPGQPLGDMVRIPGGTFMMGTNSSRAQEYERPARPVNVGTFYVDRRPVTNGEFARFVDANPEWRKDPVIDRYGIPYYLCEWVRGQPPQDRENFPVVYVSWYAADAYAAWMGKRLVREAEWEFALRDGNHDQNWDYPNGETSTVGIHPYIQNQFQETVNLPAEQRLLNLTDDVHEGRVLRRYGLVDMNGNVNEWVADWFSDDHHYFTKLQNELRDMGGALEDFTGPDQGTRKVVRGGSFLFEDDDQWTPFTTFYRRPLPPVNTNQDCGFRCALSEAEYLERVRRNAPEHGVDHAADGP